MSDCRQVIRGLRSTRTDERQAAVEQLQFMGQEARFALVPLVQICGDENEELRAAATDVLEEMGPPDPEDCPALALLLSSSDYDTVFWAATMLGRAGRASAAQVPALQEVLEEPHGPQPMLERVAWALSRIGSDGAIRCLERVAQTSTPLGDAAARCLIEN